MTDDERPRRHRRRATRPAGTVGGDEANLRTSLPVPGPDRVAWDAPAPDEVAAEGPAAADPAHALGRPFRRAPDDEDVGWGAPVADSNDDRLTRDRPPHW